jgi:hypothetical protein
MARREALSREALALAEASGDPLALADALNARYWAALGPDRSRERLEVASALRALGDRTGDRRALILAGECAYGAYLVLGDASGAARALDDWERAATALRQPGYSFIVAVARSSWALTQGRFAEAESRLAEAVKRGGRTFPYAGLLHAGQSFWLRYVRGDDAQLDGLPALVEGLLALPAFRTIGRCATLLGHLFGGDLAAARRVFDGLAAHGFDDLERDENWLLVMAMLTDAALWLGDAPRAALLVRHLEPYGDLMLAHELVRAVSSSVANGIGSLSSLLGRHDVAEAWLVRGIAKAEAMGARTAVVSGRASLARALDRRGGPGDRRRARAEQEAAEAEAAALGMRLAGRHPWLAGETR